MRNLYKLPLLVCAFLIFTIIKIHATDQPQYMRLQLAQDSLTTDDLVIRFKEAAKMTYETNLDARYMQGYGAVSLYSCSQDNIPLGINVVPPPKQAPEVIRLCVSSKTDGTYKLNLTAMINIPPLYEVWLMDNYINDSLNMCNYKTYSFNIYKNDSLSYGSKRFALVIRQNPALAYHLVSFSASKITAAKQIKLTWETANEQSNTRFTVEKSIDNGKNFAAIAYLPASGQATYNLADKNPAAGENLYRLKQEDDIDTAIYSKTVSANYSSEAITKAPKISIYPNPANDRISFSAPTQTNNNTSYKIELMDTSGVMVKEIVSSSPLWQGNVDSLHPGVYLVHIRNNNTNTSIGDGKFIKL